MLTGGRCSAATRTASTTSATLEQHATRAGRRSTSPFQTRRTRSYSGCRRSTSVPPKPGSSALRRRRPSSAGIVRDPGGDTDAWAPVQQRHVDPGLLEDLRPELIDPVLARPDFGVPGGLPDDVVADEEAARGE